MTMMKLRWAIMMNIQLPHKFTTWWKIWRVEVGVTFLMLIISCCSLAFKPSWFGSWFTPCRCGIFFIAAATAALGTAGRNLLVAWGRRPWRESTVWIVGLIVWASWWGFMRAWSMRSLCPVAFLHWTIVHRSLNWWRPHHIDGNTPRPIVWHIVSITSTARAIVTAWVPSIVILTGANIFNAEQPMFIVIHWMRGIWRPTVLTVRGIQKRMEVTLLPNLNHHVRIQWCMIHCEEMSICLRNT